MNHAWPCGSDSVNAIILSSLPATWDPRGSHLAFLFETLPWGEFPCCLPKHVFVESVYCAVLSAVLLSAQTSEDDNLCCRQSPITEQEVDLRFVRLDGHRGTLLAPTFSWTCCATLACTVSEFVGVAISGAL